MENTSTPTKTYILEISAGKYMEVSQEQVALFNALSKSEATLRKTQDSITATIRQQLVVMYGDTPPSFAQYKGDIAALKAQCLKASIADKYTLDVYAQTVALVYGDKLSEIQSDIAHGANARLPLAANKEAVALRAKRATEKQSRAQVADSTPAKRSDDASHHAPTESEAIEQYVAKVGIEKILLACQHILGSDASTQMQAKVLAGMLTEITKKMTRAAARVSTGDELKAA